MEKGASAIARSFRQSNGALRVKRGRTLPFPVVSRSSRRRGTGRCLPFGKDFRYSPSRAGTGRVHDTVIPTPALARTSGNELPGRDLAESSIPLGTASRRSSSSPSGQGKTSAGGPRRRGGTGEVYRDDKSAISGPRFINAYACAHLFSSSLLSASFALLLSCSLRPHRRHADKRQIGSFP